MTVARSLRVVGVLGMAIGLLFGSALALAGQEEGEGRGLDPRTVAKADGPSGLKWIGGDRGSPFMHPGVDCIACHTQGEGPRFRIAGTVYTNRNEPDDYFGVEGLTVQVTDAKGVVTKLVTNKAGNFFTARSAAAPALPLHVKIIGPKAERSMLSGPPSGDCALCHTQRGANGAPGRIMAP